MLTDEHEHAMKVAEKAYSAGNLVTCDGYYEFDLDAAAAVIAADRAGLVAEVERLREALLWYERQASDYRKITTEGEDARYALERDGGTLARAALKDTRHDT